MICLVCVSLMKLMIEVSEVILISCIRKLMVGGSDSCVVCGMMIRCSVC